MRVPQVYEYRLQNAEDMTPSKTVEVDIHPQEYYDDVGLFDDPKEFNRFIIRLKYLCRNSYEYKRLMKFLKKCRGMWCCGVHNNVTMWDGFKINIHHTPFVMEDIVYIVVYKRLKMEESMCMSDIADEVMMLHYLGLIGLYPLCETCHEYAHGDQNDLFIPLDSIFGEPERFYEIYKDFIADSLKTKFKNLKTLNEGYNLLESEIPDGLIRKYIYVVNKGQEMMSMKALYSVIDKFVSVE